MTGARVTCVHCKAVLKSAKPVPPGVHITCPQCKKAFTTTDASSEAASGESSGPTPAAAVGPSDTGPSEAEAAPPGAGFRLAMIGMFFAVLVGLGGFLIYLCLPGQGDRSEPSPDALMAEVPPPPDSPKTKIKPALVDLTPEEDAAVQKMRKRTLAWLKKAQQPSGGYSDGWVAFTSLAGLTLLESGVPPSDPAVKKAADYVRNANLGAAQDNGAARVTYNLSVSLLFLNRLGDEQDKGLLRQLAMRLVAGQGWSGGWGYSCPPLDAKDAKVLEDVLRDMGTTPLPEFRKRNPKRLFLLPEPVRRLTIVNTPPEKTQPPREITEPFNPWTADNSNTQFALLALWTARKHNLPVDAALGHVVRRFRTTQGPDGMWPYHERVEIANKLKVPSMTCAGLLGLAVGYGIDSRSSQDWRQDEAIRKGLRHVAQAIGTPNLDPKAKAEATDLYFLWCLERVAVLFRQSKIEGKDWYRWGLGRLRPSQKDDGSWFTDSSPGSSPLVDTCLALLFLNRSNLTSDLTDKLDEVLQLAETPAAKKK